MEVCDKCGRILEEEHECSKILVDNEIEIEKILKVEPQSALLSQMERLELNKGDLLLFSYDSHMDISDIQKTGSQIVSMIEEYKDELVPVIFLPDTFSLQSMAKSDLKSFIDDAQEIYDGLDDEEVIIQ